MSGAPRARAQAQDHTAFGFDDEFCALWHATVLPSSRHYDYGHGAANPAFAGYASAALAQARREMQLTDAEKTVPLDKLDAVKLYGAAQVASQALCAQHRAVHFSVNVDWGE